MKGGSYREGKKASINLTDLDFYTLLKRADSYISAFEKSAETQRIISEGKSAFEDLLNAKKAQERQYNGYGTISEVFPVISLILYFGETHWKEPRTLSGVLQKKSCPRELNDFLNEVKLNICEVSFLSEEELSCFHSDFRVVAEFFVRKRRDPLYIPQDKEKLRHVQEVLTLLSTVTGDSRYTQVLENNIEEVQSMCDVAQRLENIGRQKGFTEGIQEGRQEGEVKMLFRLTASGVLTMNEALREAASLGIKDKDDFVRQAEKAGFTVNG